MSKLNKEIETYIGEGIYFTASSKSESAYIGSLCKKSEKGYLMPVGQASFLIEELDKIRFKNEKL